MPLAPNQVDVWEVFLDDADLCRQAAILTAEERARAKRFHRAIHSQRFLARRVALRLRLAAYLDAYPARIEIAFGPKGKPYLPGGELDFNLSHSFDRALIGFSLKPLGIDIERLRPIKEALKLAARFFSPDEASAVRALPPERLYEGFFEIWTMKEAYVKATGEGLSRPLSSFTVSLGAGELALTPALEDARNWSLYRLELTGGFLGGLAAEGSGHHIRYRATEARP